MKFLRTLGSGLKACTYPDHAAAVEGVDVGLPVTI